MRLDELLAERPRTLSFEYFPPRGDRGTLLWQETVRQLADLGPDFVSVTYGAGGTTRDGTRDAIAFINEHTDLPSMAHLTCVGNSRQEIAELLDDYAAAGIDNLLALRGDPPKGVADWQPHPEGFTYASELLAAIHADGRFGTACAAFPEGHPDAPDRHQDWQNLATKLQSGVSLGITQAFFDADHYLAMVRHLREAGVTTPVVPGILPVRSWSWANQFVERFCPTTSLPETLRAELEPLEGNPIACRKAGVAFTIRLCQDLLAAGAPGLHIYTLNKVAPTAEVVTALRLLGSLD